MSNTRHDEKPQRYRKLELDGYTLPSAKILSPEEEVALGRRIQQGNTSLSRLIELATPILAEVFDSADTTPFHRTALFRPALAGVRQAVEYHALSSESDCDFIDCATTMIQQAMAEYIDGNDRMRSDCGGDGTQWVSSRLTRELLENYTWPPVVSDSELLASLRDRSEACKTLASAYCRLLRSMVAAQQGRRHIDDADLMQRSYLALCQAARSFDPKRHPTFSPLARRAIANEIENARRDTSGATASACRLIGEFRKEEARLAVRSGERIKGVRNQIIDEQRQVCYKMRHGSSETSVGWWFDLPRIEPCERADADLR